MLKQSAMAAVMAGLVLAGTAHGQVQLDPSLTPYKAVSGVSGNVSSVGSDTLNNLMTHWAESFQRARTCANRSVCSTPVIFRGCVAHVNHSN